MTLTVDTCISYGIFDYGSITWLIRSDTEKILIPMQTQIYFFQAVKYGVVLLQGCPNDK